LQRELVHKIVFGLFLLGHRVPSSRQIGAWVSIPGPPRGSSAADTAFCSRDSFFIGCLLFVNLQKKSRQNLYKCNINPTFFKNQATKTAK